MKTILFAFVFLTLFGTSQSLRSEQLSETAEFSLITVTPGDDLYSCFGHSAFLLQDTIREEFKMYNYGTFNFDDPDFYWNFVRGKLKYKLSVEDPRELVYGAKMENRAVIQQVLTLSQLQKQRLYDFLENNALPVNQYYHYDFFYDNCSSRLRDALVYACGDSVHFNLKPASEDKSFRGLIDPFLENKRYQDLGMDLGLGLPSDKIATPYQYMFLPDHLKNGFSSATVVVNGKEERLVFTESVVLPNTPDTSTTPFYFKPWVAFVLFFLVVLAITYSQHKRDKGGYWLDVILFGVTGIFGLVLIFLWFFTDHGVTVKNYNLIWANPLHLIAIPMLLMGKKLKKLSQYFLVSFFVIFFLLIFWNFVPQELNANIIPFLMAIGLRSMYIYYRIDKKFVRWQH